MIPRIKEAPNIRKRIIFFASAVIIIYAVWNGRNLILGPRIAILSPEDGIALDSKPVVVSGIVKNGSFISLNGRQIFTDQTGLFREEILPLPGYNILEATAEDRFGKKTVKTIRFYYNN